MAGTILADDIQHSTAGSVGTEYVVSGSVKFWVNAVQQGTTAINDSLNISSITDQGVGRSLISYTNNMNNINYCASGLNRDGGGYNDDFNIGLDNGGTWSTSALQFWCHNNGTANDCDNQAMVSAVGDLA
jgi:hypothetical protein